MEINGKKIKQGFMNPNYKKFYKIYRKLPAIITIALAAVILIFSLVFFFIGLDDWNWKAIEAFGFLIGTWVVGGIACGLTWFFYSLIYSISVVLVDSVMEIEGKLSSENQKEGEENEQYMHRKAFFEVYIVLQIFSFPRKKGDKPLILKGKARKQYRLSVFFRRYEHLYIR